MGRISTRGTSSQVDLAGCTRCQLSSQEIVHVNASLSQYRPECSFWHVCGMVWHGCIKVRDGIKPDFVTTGSLAVEFETAHPQFPDDLAIAKAGQAAHLRSDHDGVVAALTGRREVWRAVALAPGLDQLPGNVTCDLQSLGNRPTLRYEAGKFIRSAKENPFRQLLDLYVNGQLHRINRTIHLNTRVNAPA